MNRVKCAGGIGIVLAGVIALLGGCASAGAGIPPRTVSGGWIGSPAEEQDLQQRYEELREINEGLYAKIQELQDRPPETVVVREVRVVSEVEEVPVYHDLREFQDVNELQEWVENWAYTPTSINGTVDLLSDANDCDDWTLAMVRDATRDGYITGVVLDLERSHLFVCCIIGNYFYFIEPQSGDIYETLHNTYWLID